LQHFLNPQCHLDLIASSDAATTSVENAVQMQPSSPTANDEECKMALPSEKEKAEFERLLREPMVEETPESVADVPPQLTALMSSQQGASHSLCASREQFVESTPS